MEKIRGIKIKGNCSPDFYFVVYSTLLALRRSQIRLPKEVRIRKQKGGRGDYSDRYISIRENLYENYQGENLVPFFIIHEVVHSLGYRGHNKRFYRKFINICKSLNLNPDKWFSVEYKLGQRYWAKSKKRSKK